jgi:hypothetical protein
MRKKHGFVPKIHTCSGPDSHNEQDTGTQGAITNGTPAPPSQVRTTPHVGGPAGRRNPRWLTAARTAAAIMTSAPGGQTAAAMNSRQTLLQQGPRPRPPPKGRGHAECRRVGGQSAGGASYLVGGETSSSCLGGRWHRKQRRSRSGQRARHAAAASATNDERPSTRSLREGAGRCLHGDRPQLDALPSPALMMNILEAEGGAEAAALLASPHPGTGGHRLG